MIDRMLVGALVALLHITPTVVLLKREVAAKTMLPAATAFTAHEIHLSDKDAHRLHEALDWGPDDGLLTFYIGRRGGETVGALTFIRVDTPHGPLEVAVGFTPDGAVRQVAVTKATVETKPWVLEAVRSRVLEGYAGLKQAASPALPGGPAGYHDRVGRMAGYMLEQIDKGVQRAVVAYDWFYASPSLGLSGRGL